MNAAGIIFTDSSDTKIDELINKRTLASIPFGARYRLIDFPLSNMTNAGIKNVGIITQKHYQSLMQHVRAGGDWDLALKTGGLIVLPPFSGNNNHDKGYNANLEGYMPNISYLKRLSEKYVIVADCTAIGNFNFTGLVEHHIDSGARMTCMYTKNPLNHQPGINASWISVDQRGKVTDMKASNGTPEGMYMCANVFVFNREDVIDIVQRFEQGGSKPDRRAITLKIAEARDAHAIEITEDVLLIENLSGYLASNLSLLNVEILDRIFHNDNGPIVTPARDSAPTRYGPDAKVSDSLIAAGAIIEGRVRNSVIGRGVKIEEGAVVENSVVMKESVIAANARINYAIIDKFARINKNRLLSGYITHPFYCSRWSWI